MSLIHVIESDCRTGPLGLRVITHLIGFEDWQ